MDNNYKEDMLFFKKRVEELEEENAKLKENNRILDQELTRMEDREFKIREYIENKIKLLNKK